MAGKMGQWAFVAGIVIALVLGLSFFSEWAGQLTLALVILGLVVGILNVSEKEATSFLVASIALLATGTASGNLKLIWLVGDYLATAVGNIAVFVAPAAILVAVKAIWGLAKD